jgi:hypothetical protein
LASFPRKTGTLNCLATILATGKLVKPAILGAESTSPSAELMKPGEAMAMDLTSPSSGQICWMSWIILSNGAWLLSTVGIRIC